MFNFWIFCVLFFIMALQMSLIFVKNSLHVFFVSEICWILFITGALLSASLYSDPRFYLFAVMFLFFAALEIVVYLLVYIFKR